MAALLLVPGAAAIALAFQSGGYGTRATALVATEMALLLAVWLVLAPGSRATMTRAPRRQPAPSIVRSNCSASSLMR